MAEVSGRLPGDALHAALFSRLDADVLVTAPVYDALPRNLEQSAEFPRIMLTAGFFDVEYIKGATAGQYQPIFEWHVLLDIYSDGRGWKECHEIAGTIKVSLDATFLDLSSTNFTVTDQESDYSYDREWDSANAREIRHGNFDYMFRIADDL